MSDNGTTILHTEWATGWGGQEMRILAESRTFRDKGYNVIIACQPQGRLMVEARRVQVPTVPLRLRKGLTLGAVVATWSIIRRHQVDLVHTHSSVDAWRCGLAARVAGVPVVRSRHLSTPIKRGVLSNFVYMRLADRVITSGQAIKDEMVQRNGMREERIVSIPAGIDEHRFSPVVDGSAVRQALGLAPDDFVVGIVAVLRVWKGHRYLIEAIRHLRARGDDIKLMIVGSGPQEENLKRMIRERGLEQAVIMTGHRDDVPQCMAAMDCVVLPSTRNEATSQVLPQAMAMKKPVIAANAGGLSEVVIDGETGLLVPPASVEALAEAIARLRARPQETRRIAERGYHHCLKHFTFSGMIERTEAVYRDVLGDRVHTGAIRDGQS